ncbi:hypothetical protein Ahy_A10g051325 isoform E [Arachis hypogaea]|uniref:Outer envelope membrane protein 7 n=2 Tax=Arachis TaxID=3817 RepID=A0A445BCF3_ARAHY|nr:hypothetical protein Ahy_A10g051325 isoform E [Arachis hypogaea]
MGAITSAVIAVAAVLLGWATIEIACKPCLEMGREAIDRNLNPDYDPDDDNRAIRAPLNPSSAADTDESSSSAPSTAVKSVRSCGETTELVASHKATNTNSASE